MLSAAASVVSLSTCLSPPSPMFRDIRHVGHDASCSSQECRHELRKHKHSELNSTKESESIKHSTFSKCHNSVTHAWKNHFPLLYLIIVFASHLLYLICVMIPKSHLFCHHLSSSLGFQMVFIYYLCHHYVSQVHLALCQPTNVRSNCNYHISQRCGVLLCPCVQTKSLVLTCGRDDRRAVSELNSSHPSRLHSQRY